ncbi:hypothetical protein EVG20_g1546 [Dentipellis fragilis]|uniref:Protein kinase domain-containing protein n=1 Tax=Dentipellis fragilis TaxID=205917 RepID=A0A4Y9ZCD8_9AGAM|nr:hypothetical protein EVG20_g1546 [Dentipellis fragilis]
MASSVEIDPLEARRERVFGPRTEEHRRFAEDRGIVAFGETWWRDHHDTLFKLGYALRSRYHPNWTPPWRGTGRSYKGYEEGQSAHRTIVMDAIRRSDGSFVTLKRMNIAHGKSDIEEIEINKYLSSTALAADPRNHTAQAIETFQLPDEQDVYILVMPSLRPLDDPLFTTFGEAVAFFTQLFEGLQFMHEHRIAHRDCCHDNVMMDATPMYPEPWHPIKLDMRRDWKGKARHYTRTERPVKYYYIDFGLAQHYKPEHIQPWPPFTLPVHGGDKTAPENQEDKYDKPCNPFATDIYYLGNLIRESFMQVCFPSLALNVHNQIRSQKYYGFGFMRKLVADMVQDEPSKRPEITEIVTRFAKIRESLHTWKLRSRTIPRKEWKIDTLWRYPLHIARTVRFVVTRKPVIPDP